MKNSFGTNLIFTLFGESHGECVGCILDGISPGIDVDLEYIKKQLWRRRPRSALSTGRIETDEFVIESGVFNGKTTGAPICILIPNTNVKSNDYEESFIFTYCPDGGHDRPGTVDLRHMAHHAARCRN